VGEKGASLGWNAANGRGGGLNLARTGAKKEGLILLYTVEGPDTRGRPSGAYGLNSLCCREQVIGEKRFRQKWRPKGTRNLKIKGCGRTLSKEEDSIWGGREMGNVNKIGLEITRKKRVYAKVTRHYEVSF